MNIDKAVSVLDKAYNILSSDSNGVKMCLFQGTLLGAHRDHGIIVGDHDIDIILFCTADVFNGLRYTFKHNDFNIRELLDGKFLSISIDDVIIDMQLGQFIGDMFVLESPATIDKYPRNLFDNLTTIELYKHTYFAPSPIEEYLYLCYGKNWHEPKSNTDRDNLMERIWKI